MLLFQKRFHDGLVSGAVTLTFRRWPKARVRPGGRYRCHPIGVLAVSALSQVPVADITEQDACCCGFASRDELLAYMRTASDEPLLPSSLVWRVTLKYGEDGDRVEGALDEVLSEDEVRDIAARLAKLDGGTPWTQATLSIIAERPRVAASQLAAALGRETKPFKADVVKLKKLGLTQSFEVGYEISPRGRVFLAAVSR